MTPPQLDTSTYTYMVVTLRAGGKPADINETSSADHLAYVGQVGELADEHIYSIATPTSEPPAAEAQQALERLLEQPNVLHAELMVGKRRQKRVSSALEHAR